MFARDQFWQIFPFLRFVAVAAQLVDAQIGMRPVGQADRGRRPRNLLDRDAMLEVPEPRAAIFLLDGNAVQPERADFRPEVAGKLITLVDLVGARRNLVARKIVHGLANSVRGFAEIEVEHPVRVGNHVGRPPGILRLSRAQPYALETSLSRAEVAEKGAFPEPRSGAAEGDKTLPCSGGRNGM